MSEPVQATSAAYDLEEFHDMMPASESESERRTGTYCKGPPSARLVPRLQGADRKQRVTRLLIVDFAVLRRRQRTFFTTQRQISSAKFPRQPRLVTRESLPKELQVATCTAVYAQSFNRTPGRDAQGQENCMQQPMFSFSARSRRLEQSRTLGLTQDALT